MTADEGALYGRDYPDASAVPPEDAPDAPSPRAESAESAERPDLRVLGSDGDDRNSAESAESAIRTALDAFEPVELGAADLPPFPVEVLPPWCADMVLAVAEAMQVPADSPGSVCLGALATAASGRAEVRPRRDWREQVNLYVIVTARSSERKSPVMRVMRGPIDAAERVLMAAWGPAAREAEALRRIVQGQASSAERSAEKLADPAARQKAVADAVALGAEAAGIEVPPPPRLTVGGDATPEALAALLVKHGGRIAVWDAEGGLFDRLAGMYSNMPNLETVLKAYVGEPIGVERRGSTEGCDRATLTLVLMVQPVTLAKLSRDREMVGRGFVARPLYALPESLVGRRKTGRAVTPIPDAVEDDYRESLVALTVGMAGWTDPAVLELDPDALDVFDQEEARTEQRLSIAGDLAATGAWGGKHDGRTLRLAGLLHLAALGAEKGPRTPIAAETVKAAITVSDYYADHARAALAPPDTLGSARRVLAHLRDRRWHSGGVRAEDRRDLGVQPGRQVVGCLGHGATPSSSACLQISHPSAPS